MVFILSAIKKPMNKILTKCLEVLRSGGLILYPTDTIWGIGCDACREDAVEKVIQLKGRSADKSLIVLLDTPGKLASYVREVPELAYDLIEFSNKPLTIVFDGARNLAPNVLADDGSVGIRIVQHTFCTPLIQRFRKPIVSTSANISGAPAPTCFQDIAPEILEGVDYIVPLEQDLQGNAKASSIIKLGASGLYRQIRP